MSEIKTGRPQLFDSAEQLQDLIDGYFNSDDAYIDLGGDKVFAPTMSGLAMHLDIDRKTLVNYGKKDAFFHTIKKARSRIEQHLEQRLYGNNVTGVIFNLKNNYGWADKQEAEEKTLSIPVTLNFTRAKKDAD